MRIEYLYHGQALFVDDSDNNWFPRIGDTISFHSCHKDDQTKQIIDNYLVESVSRVYPQPKDKLIQDHVNLLKENQVYLLVFLTTQKEKIDLIQRSNENQNIEVEKSVN
jgi:hypothetical protein